MRGSDVEVYLVGVGSDYITKVKQRIRFRLTQRISLQIENIGNLIANIVLTSYIAYYAVRRL